MSLSPADIAVMRRLMKKTNILPIIARADSLTDDKLAAIKRVVRRDLEAAGLDLGVFAPTKEETRGRSARSNGNGAAPEPTRQASDDTQEDEDDEDDEPEEERSARTVIKLKPSRNPFKRWSSRSRSRTRLELAEQVDEPATVDIMDNESVAHVRFSAARVAKTDLADMLPFAIIAPENSKRRRQRQAQLALAAAALTDDRQSIDVAAQSEDAHGAPSVVSHASKNVPLLAGPPEDLRGVFVRQFRWGTVDVLSPEHCDYAALRTAVLSTHMKVCALAPASHRLVFSPFLPCSPCCADAEDPDEGGAVREVPDGEAAGTARNKEYQPGPGTAHVRRNAPLAADSSVSLTADPRRARPLN